MQDEQSHGVTEKTKRDQMKITGPKKDFKTVQEKTEEILEHLQPDHRETLRGIISEYKTVFHDKLPKGRPPRREVVVVVPSGGPKAPVSLLARCPRLHIGSPLTGTRASDVRQQVPVA